MKNALPRGIQAVQYKDSTYFRVRISRKTFKADRYFKDLKEAKEFLALSKAVKGKELIFSITEEQRKQPMKTSQREDFTLGYYIDQYIADYLSSPCTTELETRNRNNKLSFFRTIKNTSVLDRQLTREERRDLGVDTDMDEKVYRFFGGLDVRKIKAIDINNYIKSRLHFVKPVSVSRELSFISNVFRKLQYFNEDLADIANPTLLYDRDLLKNRVTKREVYLTAKDEVAVFKVLRNRTNKELLLISQASLLTGLRRSEIVLLRASQVKDTHIDLVYTKSGRARKVYLTHEAKTFFSKLKVQPDGRFFNYTIGGFDKMFREVMKKNDLSHFHFHDLRRTNISRLLSRIGQDNTILATEILGIQSLSKFEELHVSDVPTEPHSQGQAVKNWHNSKQTTKGYFNIVFKPTKAKTEKKNIPK